jgi:hypothetical protein
MNAYKLLSILLAVVLAGGGIFYAFERSSNSSKRRELNNQIAELEGTVQETETAFSRRAIEVSKLKLDNEELRDKIKDRGEEAVALSEAILKWKDKYFKIKDATESAVDHEGKVVIIEPGCEECFSKVRLRVDFEGEYDSFRVFGFTLTNPPYSEVTTTWIQGLKLSLVLTKDKDDLFRVYLDTDSPDLVPAELKLSVDPSILDRRWYEKIGMGSDITIGEGLVSSLKIVYDVFDNWSLGPVMMLNYDGDKLRKTYGISTTWYPFR